MGALARRPHAAPPRFHGRYRSALLPCVEDSNSRTADAQLAARVGLWLAGEAGDWACRVSADWFSFNRAWEWEAVRTGHPHLRYLTSQAFLGARVFMLLAGDRERRSGAGPHDYVCLLPGGAPAPGRPWTSVWTTDGDQLSRGGKAFPLAAARTAIEADLRTAAARLPFRVEGRVCWQAVAQPDDGYILCLLDPGWVDPAPRTATVRAQLPGPWRVRDRLTGEPLGPLGPAREFAVPAGVFRLLELSAPVP